MERSSTPSPLPPSLTLKTRSIEGLHILTLFAFAVAQPLYSLLGSQTGFFTANQMDGVDVLLITLTLSLGLALPLIFIRELAGLIHKQVRTGLLAGIIVILLTAIFLPLVNSLNPVIGGVPAGLLLAIALLLAGISTFLYLQKATARSLLTFLSPVVVIFPLLFICFSDATALIFEAPISKTPENTAATAGLSTPQNLPPIVMVVLDELPLASLVDAHGEIDATRFPNFARLAHEGTWYKNTYTVGASTLWAVPAIVSGQSPSDEEKHSNGELTHNLFTLFGTTHQLKNISEKHTALCPETLCKARKKKRFKRLKSSVSDLAVVYLHIITPPKWAKHLPDVSNNWGDFSWNSSKAPEVPQIHQTNPVQANISAPKTQTPKRMSIDPKTTRPGKKAVANHKRGLFQKFIRRIQPHRPGEKPTLNFMHILMPHVPYNYTPSGKHYRIGPYRYFTKWEHEQDIFFDYQRHLLQVGATDALLGDMIQRLETLGLYNDTLIIVVADHGANWSGIGEERRKLTSTNYADLIQVPLFIKAPHQTQGQTVKKPVRLLDILPTIADITRIPLDTASFDGHSMLRDDYPEITSVEVVDNQGEKRYTFATNLDITQSPSLKNKLAWFGTGDWGNVFSSGKNKPWVGQSLQNLTIIPPKESPWAFQLHSPDAYEAVELDDDFIPALIEGEVVSITGKSKSSFPKRLAISVNGVIQCTMPRIITSDGNRFLFGGLVPESSFKAGQNSIQIFSIETGSANGDEILREIRSL